MGTLVRSMRRATVGSGVAVALLSVLLALPAAGQEHHPDGILPPGDWTEEEMAHLHDLVERTEAALPAFEDVASIQALGFEDFGATAPGGYDHWINWDWVDDGHLIDPEFPESLVFRRSSDGAYHLEAAMFLADSEHDLSNLPEDIAWLPGWHNHADVCKDENGHFTGLTGIDGQCFSGEPFDKPPMMHVWIVDNACGHRFGEIGIGGLVCDVEHGNGHEPGHDPDPGHHGGAEPGEHTAPPAAPAAPAPPVLASPTFTG